MVVGGSGAGDCRGDVVGDAPGRGCGAEASAAGVWVAGRVSEEEGRRRDWRSFWWALVYLAGMALLGPVCGWVVEHWRAR